MRIASSCAVLTALLLLVASPAAVADDLSKEPAPPEVAQLVQGAIRTAYEKADAGPLLAMWAADGVDVLGRGPTPDDLDVTLSRAQLARTACLIVTDPALRGGRISFDRVRTRAEADEVTLEMRIRYSVGPSTEVGSSRFRLRRAGRAWQITAHRYWPLSYADGERTTTFASDEWQRRDAALEVARKSIEPAAVAVAALLAHRYPEAQTAAREAAAALPTNPDLWGLLGYVSAVIGDADTAVAAYRKARSLDRERPIPTCVQPE